MKHLSIITALLISISAYGMNLKTVMRKVPEFIRTLTGDIFVDYLCSSHFNCNSLDDQTAITLRTITKKLYSTINEHRNAKIAAHKQWINETATDPYTYKQHHDARNFKPALIIQDNILSSQWCVTHSYCFLEGIKSKFDPSQHCTLLPASLIIGPSGNTAYYCAIARKDGTETQNIQFWERYRFTIHKNGTIALKDKEKLNDRNFNVNTHHNTPSVFYCYTNAEHTQLLAVELTNPDKEKTKKSTVICASARAHSTSYAHTNPTDFCSYSIPVFTPSSIAINISIDHSAHPSYFAYHCENGGATITCYEHFVALDDATTLSIAKAPLKSYLLQCPSKKVYIENTKITPSPQRLVHTFEPNEIYPAEIFERWKAVTLHILHKKKVENAQEKKYESQYGDEYLNNLLVEDHARYYQIDRLIYANHCGDSFAHRLATKRSEAATIYCDMYGWLHHIPQTGDNRTRIDGCFFEPTYSTDLWLRHLVPIGPLPSHCASSLSKNPAFALQCSAQEFIALIKEETLMCTQQTWDNGTIAAAWKFDDQGMRVRLYNLKTEANNYIIGDYLIQNKMIGSITDVTYEDNQNPIFYVDGEAVTF